MMHETNGTDASTIRAGRPEGTLCASTQEDVMTRSTTNPTTHHRARRLGVALAAATLLLGAAACGGDDDSTSDTTAASATTVADTTVDTTAEPDTEAPATTAATATTAAGVQDVDAFCQAELAVEAAVSSEDPALIEPAFTAITAAAPADIKDAVDAVVAAASANETDGPEFTENYGAIIQFVKDNCGFGAIDVTASEYAFGGAPVEVPAGPVVVSLTNTGTELHEFAIARINDGVTESIDEILALPEDQALSKVTPVGTAFTFPGEQGFTAVDLEPGEYVAVCFLPQGATPDNLPLLESGELTGTPHAILGMVAPFTVS
jgi:hypothetical protein